MHKINERDQTLQVLYFQNSHIYIKELLITSPERKPLIKNSNKSYYMALQHWVLQIVETKVLLTAAVVVVSMLREHFIFFKLSYFGIIYI
jgi:CMP-N-acetylneuraminic acid synthetase